MKLVIILGVIFVLWEGFITHLFPAHSREHYEKAAQKWSTGLPLALIGWMDMLSMFGLAVVCIASFFVMSVIQALIFCGVIIIILLFNPAVLKSRKQYTNTLKAAKERHKK